MKTRALIASLLAACACSSQAAVIFSDNFDANTSGLNSVPIGWTVSAGSVDIVGPGFFDFYPGNGLYVDLDGTTNDAGVLAHSFTLTGGTTYQASFTLGGSTRGDSNTVDVTFGSGASSITLASGAPLALHTLAFTPATSGSYSLSFANSGGDNIGLLLLDVLVESVSAIPEPKTSALMLAGLMMLGVLTTRRRSLAALPAAQPGTFSRQ